jgi:POT family proton-dependent oligopeptide transporter
MAIGLVIYKKTTARLNGVGAEPTHPMSEKGKKISWGVIAASLVTLAIVTVSAFNGSLVINPVVFAENTAIIFAIIFVVYFFGIYFLGNLNQNEKKGMGALLLVCVASICFWSGFEQAGSSLNLFARDYTDRMIGSFEIPTGWFQSLNSFFIIALSPFFAALWINLSKKMISPSYGIKTAVGLIIMATGFLVMFAASQYAVAGLKVAPYWLVATYFLHTVGELCLSPVALSAVSKLSPKRFSGQLMGVFVLTYSIGNLISGLLAGNYDPNNVEQIPSLYLQISLFSIGIGIVVVLLSFKTKAWEKAAEDK